MEDRLIISISQKKLDKRRVIAGVETAVCMDAQP